MRAEKHDGRRDDALASIAATALGAATTFWVIVAAHEAAE